MNNRAIKIISGTIFTLAIISAVYMMINQLGIIEGLDFGAGAYYYADIPEFDKYVNEEAYKSPVSFCVILMLFMIWGTLMYKFMLWVDKKGRRE